MTGTATSDARSERDLETAARRERMVDAAVELAVTGGYESVQMRDVAARAEVALGTLYRHFPSKDHLLLAALTDGYSHRPNAEYSRALSLLLDFITRYQADPADGIWYDTVEEDGKPKNPAKAHSWKANYHDVRALVKFIDAFSPPVR